MAVGNAIAIFDIDGVVRDVSGSYRRAIADTVEHFTQSQFRPSPQAIDTLKEEGCWNNDWLASQELTYRYWESQGKTRDAVDLDLDYDILVDFFQRRYRGEALSEPSQWNGYITQEPLLMSAAYVAALEAAGILWAFFSGATRRSACYVLEHRLHLSNPILIAMEDAPGKPDPTGMRLALDEIESRYPEAKTLPVIYVGDTVADMQTVLNARKQWPARQWLAVGVLPPHVQLDATYASHYAAKLEAAGAQGIVNQVEAMDADYIAHLLRRYLN
jgi:HAD superfamily phosphatase